MSLADGADLHHGLAVVQFGKHRRVELFFQDDGVVLGLLVAVAGPEQVLHRVREVRQVVVQRLDGLLRGRLPQPLVLVVAVCGVRDPGLDALVEVLQTLLDVLPQVALGAFRERLEEFVELVARQYGGVGLPQRVPETAVDHHRRRHVQDGLVEAPRLQARVGDAVQHSECVRDLLGAEVLSARLAQKLARGTEVGELQRVAQVVARVVAVAQVAPGVLVDVLEERVPHGGRHALVEVVVRARPVPDRPRADQPALALLRDRPALRKEVLETDGRGASRLSGDPGERLVQLALVVEQLVPVRVLLTGQRGGHTEDRLGDGHLLYEAVDLLGVHVVRNRLTGRPPGLDGACHRPVVFTVRSGVDVLHLDGQLGRVPVGPHRHHVLEHPGDVGDAVLGHQEGVFLLLPGPGPQRQPGVPRPDRAAPCLDPVLDHAQRDVEAQLVAVPVVPEAVRRVLVELSQVREGRRGQVLVVQVLQPVPHRVPERLLRRHLHLHPAGRRCLRPRRSLLSRVRGRLVEDRVDGVGEGGGGLLGGGLREGLVLVRHGGGGLVADRRRGPAGREGVGGGRLPLPQRSDEGRRRQQLVAVPPFVRVVVGDALQALRRHGTVALQRPEALASRVQRGVLLPLEGELVGEGGGHVVQFGAPRRGLGRQFPGREESLTDDRGEGGPDARVVGRADPRGLLRGEDLVGAGPVLQRLGEDPVALFPGHLPGGFAQDAPVQPLLPGQVPQPVVEDGRPARAGRGVRHGTVEVLVVQVEDVADQAGLHAGADPLGQGGAREVPQARGGRGVLAVLLLPGVQCRAGPLDGVAGEAFADRLVGDPLRKFAQDRVDLLLPGAQAVGLRPVAVLGRRLVERAAVRLLKRGHRLAPQGLPASRGESQSARVRFERGELSAGVGAEVFPRLSGDVLQTLREAVLGLLVGEARGQGVLRPAQCPVVGPGAALDRLPQVVAEAGAGGQRLLHTVAEEFLEQGPHMSHRCRVGPVLHRTGHRRAEPVEGLPATVQDHLAHALAGERVGQPLRQVLGPVGPREDLPGAVLQRALPGLFPEVRGNLLPLRSGGPGVVGGVEGALLVLGEGERAFGRRCLLDRSVLGGDLVDGRRLGGVLRGGLRQLGVVLGVQPDLLGLPRGPAPVVRREV
ncbi:hypothetical protein ACFV3R_00425 [Streptomyces sp. NPDC059740]|uniref:hypothetical protein n=1 Tax=Streptomyces sp. NPDC059740 TaxID=3346926 RepID=UPI003653877C